MDNELQWIEEWKTKRCPLAAQKLIDKHYGLICKISHFYTKNFFNIDDFLSEGRLAILEAALEFEPEKSPSFFNFAFFKVKEKIRKTASILNNNQITIPYYYNRIFQEIKDIIRNGKDLSSFNKQLNLSFSTLSNLVTIANSAIPLDDNSEGKNYRDLMSDPRQKKSDEIVENKEIISILRECLDSLPERWKEILGMRYGLDHGEEQTLEEISKKMQISIERVRQIQNTALSILAKKIKLKLNS